MGVYVLPPDSVTLDALGGTHKAVEELTKEAARRRADHPLMSTSPGGSEIRMMPDPWANMLAHLPPGSTLTLTIQTPEAKS